VDLSQVPEEYLEFRDVFSKQHIKHFPEHCPYDLSIQMEEGKLLLLGPIYSLSALKLKILREFIKENLYTRFICSFHSSCGAPVLFVKKKDSLLYLYINYQGLNKITSKDKYLIPLVSDLLDAPKKARIYTKIDLCSAYHLVCIAEGDKWKTTFRTKYSSYEWLVMLFGLANTPSVFQQLINEIFVDLLDIHIVVYLDNILIYSNNLVEHKKHVREVLKCLRKNRLYASPNKYTFYQEHIEFLGFVLGPRGIQIDIEKVWTIQEWPLSQCIKNI